MNYTEYLEDLNKSLSVIQVSDTKRDNKNLKVATTYLSSGIKQPEENKEQVLKMLVTNLNNKVSEGVISTVLDNITDCITLNDYESFKNYNFGDEDLVHITSPSMLNTLKYNDVVYMDSKGDYLMNGLPIKVAREEDFLDNSYFLTVNSDFLNGLCLEGFNYSSITESEITMGVGICIELPKKALICGVKQTK